MLLFVAPTPLQNIIATHSCGLAYCSIFKMYGHIRIHSEQLSLFINGGN
jgi:hypothetical protein